MDKMTTAKARRHGWTVGRGAYTGTTDDRADRWYIRWEDGGPIDRRGHGWPTRQAALDAIAERVAMAEACKGGPVVNGERFAPGYTPEAADYEQRTRPA